jgi:ornithine carbamoyltransferase
VINGLTDKEHPCQILADLLTIREQKGRLEGLRAAYVGDGNNVAHSLMLACPRVGMDLVVATPPAYRPEPDVVAAAREMAARSGTRLELVEDPVAAVSEADVVFTDVWASIGKEAEAAERERVFRPYQVNADLVRHARPDFMFLHCLPARRGEEVTEEVIDGPASFVWDAAENRLHVQKALLTLTMGE